MHRTLKLAAALAIPASVASVTSVAPTASAQAAPRVAVGTAAPLSIGETFTIASTTLGEVRRINVYIPEGTGGATAPPLPVLYMPDGGIKEDFLHIAGLLQVSIGNGTMRPFLLVGIENTERRRDMTGPTDNAEDRRIAPHVGGSAAFRTFIRNELMPAIKGRYRTTGETAVVGESLAGLFVVETLVREPDLFDTYIAFDPSLWWNNGKLAAEAPAQLRAHAPLRKTLFVATSSDAGPDTTMQRFSAALRPGAIPGLTFHYLPMPEETHATIYHPAALRAFRVLFKPAPAK